MATIKNKSEFISQHSDEKYKNLQSENDTKQLEITKLNQEIVNLKQKCIEL